MRTITAGASDAHTTPVDCAKRVPLPVDVVPIRSSQAVHSILASWFAGKIIVEIGTRNGDGMHCFAQVAHNATAIEIDKAYCRLLEKRSLELRDGVMATRWCAVATTQSTPRCLPAHTSSHGGLVPALITICAS